MWIDNIDTPAARLLFNTLIAFSGYDQAQFKRFWMPYAYCRRSDGEMSREVLAARSQFAGNSATQQEAVRIVYLQTHPGQTGRRRSTV